MQEILISLFILFGAHCIGDFSMQGTYLTENKGKIPYLLIVHSTIVTMCVLSGFIVLYVAGLAKPQYDAIALITFLSHLVIDHSKCLMIRAPNENINERVLLYVDQAIHFVFLILCYWVFA